MKCIDKTRVNGKPGKFNTHMSVRDEQWFLGDKRLIFACDDEEVFKIWIIKLRTILKLD